MQRRIKLLLSEVAALPAGRQLLLLLDYDGTLVEIAPRPELATPSRKLLQTLTRLAAAPALGAMVVSGRSLDNLQKLLPVPGLNYLGSHGADGLIGGTPWTFAAEGFSTVEQDDLRRQMLARLQDLPGWWLENKPCGFALHYRQATAASATLILSALQPWLQEVAGTGRHQILYGKKVVEILPAGVSKGAAIKKILLLPGFLGHFPIYLGDDVTDESAFQVLQGRGLTVKVGSGAQASAAAYSLLDPVEVLQFLTLLLRSLAPNP